MSIYFMNKMCLLQSGIIEDSELTMQSELTESGDILSEQKKHTFWSF